MTPALLTPEDIELYRGARHPGLLLSERSNAVDSMLSEAAADELEIAAVSPWALCAVGGYGRRELFPYSDVDLLVLAAAEPDLLTLKPQLSSLLRRLWDAGLRVSHSVRTVAECLRQHAENTELYISLLDLRFIAGHRALSATLAESLESSANRWRLPLASRLKALSLARHAKFNQTVYHLEPNVKETCGGLRDCHTLRWLQQLMPGYEPVVAAAAGLDDARHFLFQQRCFLHLLARRDANLLSFDAQDSSAAVLAAEPMTPEAWMRQYFGHARRVYQATQLALDAIDQNSPRLRRPWYKLRDRQSPSEFAVMQSQVHLSLPEETLSAPAGILRLFTFIGQRSTPAERLSLSWEAQRHLRERLPELTRQFANSDVPWPLWRDLLSQRRTAVALDEMAKVAVLLAIIPEWESIDCLVVRDFYHRYTVDEHTLVALHAVDDLAAADPGKVNTAAGRIAQLAREESDLSTLRLALLLHDLGKGTRPGDHVNGSILTAPAILQRLRAPAAVSQVVLFLIENHLHLSFLMNARDLEDPATARFLTAQVSTQEDLRRLTLLTYADISAVNPTAMTPWRLEQLWRVYVLGSEQLTRELSTDRIHLEPDTDGAMPSDATPELQRFLEGLPRRYLRTHTPEEIDRHSRMAEQSRLIGVAVDVQPYSAAIGVWELTVLAHDQPGLLAALCGVLASFGMNIVKGEAASNAVGCIVDILRFADPHRTLALNPEEIERLQQTVGNVVQGREDVIGLLKRRRTPQRQSAEATLAPVVRCNNDASDAATLIDFTGEDRPGLLYDLTSTIHNEGCNIEVLMIDTEAHRASDVFYVTCKGKKLDEETMVRVRTNLLHAANNI